AEAEMAEAARWDERPRVGVGREFVAAVDAAVARIGENPRMGSPTPGVADETVRRGVVRRFPYHVVYIEVSDRLQILRSSARSTTTRVLGGSASDLNLRAPSNGQGAQLR